MKKTIILLIIYLIIFVAVGYLCYSQGQYDGMKKLCGEKMLVEDENHKLYCKKNLDVPINHFKTTEFDITQIGVKKVD